MKRRRGQPESEIALADLTNNRQYERIPFQVPVRATIFPCEGTGAAAKTCHVLANDISEGGISILCRPMVSQGQVIQLELPDAIRQAIACRVVPVEGGRYLVGCRFEEASMLAGEKSPDQLEPLQIVGLA